MNLSTRAEQAAADGHIYATKTIRGMLTGSTCSFEDAGLRLLRRTEEQWHLYQVTSD